ncbi:MAG: ligase-associated DNA damage response DEXH box helicase [Pirellulaceae bacterium]
MPTPNQIVQSWFARNHWKPFPFQKKAWLAYQRGESGMIHSATGTGKTLAVWLGPIMKWMKENRTTQQWTPKQPPPLRVLWITPLRALAGDTENAMRKPLDELGLPWRLERRTGDSSASLKAKQLKRLPTALLTTPESLSLLLTHEKLLEQLGGLESVIVDEWHELLGTKRGIQTELGLARLRRLNPALQIWGVSATLGNLDDAMDCLLGVNNTHPRQLIRGYAKKKMVFESVIPTDMDRFPWAGHIGTKMIPQVCELVDSAGSSLIFANTRSQTEIWYRKILEHRKDWAGKIALHHGSLDNSVRHWVEDGLREGRLKTVVCTSSLDLGVDFTAVDLVIQIGSPKGVARLLQRAGRSGHQPDAVSRLAFVPTHAIELAELAAAQDAIKREQLEARPLLKKPLDVLAQHAVTIAIGGGFGRDRLLEELRTTRAYESLTDAEWDWVLRLVVHGGESLEAYPDFHRVEIVDGKYQVSQRRIISMHRMSIGTIVADAAMRVKYVSGGSLGTVEETFLTKLRPGEKFLFAGRLLELVRIRDNVAYVRRTKGSPDAVPRWYGGRLPLSSELSDSLRKKLTEAAEGKLIGREMRALKPLIDVQQQWSTLPREDELLIERVKTKGVHQLFIYPFEGRLAHEGLVAMLAVRISRLSPITFSMACNDYGMILSSSQSAPVERAIEAGLFSPDNLVRDILDSLNETEMMRRGFREIARVAGLIQQGYPGQKSAKHLQASSNLFFDVFREYDPDNLLLEQARREVLEQKLETDRMYAALSRIENQTIVVTEPPKITPLGFPLFVDRLRDRMSSETLADRVRKMQQQLESSI